MELRKRYDAEKETVDTGVVIITLPNGNDYILLEENEETLTVQKIGKKSNRLSITPRSSNSIELA
jgi:hypothetical protein